MDWFRVLVSRLPVDLQVSSTIEPATPPPTSLLGTIYRPWFYTPDGRFVSLRQSPTTDDLTLEVVEPGRRGRFTISIENSFEARIHGWGEFEPHRVPSLRSVKTGSGVRSPPRIGTDAGTTTITGGHRSPPSSVLRLLIHVSGHRGGRGATRTRVFLEVQWYQGRFTLTDYHTHGHDTRLEYALTNHGYYRLGWVGDRLTINCPDGQLRRYQLPHTWVDYQFSSDGFVVNYTRPETTGQERPAVLVVYRGSVYQYRPDLVHPRDTMLVVDRHYLIYRPSDSELRVVDLTGGVVILTFPVPPGFTYFHVLGVAYDDFHRVLFLGNMDGVVAYHDGNVTEVYRGKSGLYLAAQWLPWRSTLVAVVEGASDPLVARVVSQDLPRDLPRDLPQDVDRAGEHR